ncbi:MAG: hypothetical protein OJF50_002459 [Nitrospira sp.]|nr:hypothetical protein [Nitrospira sp.]
MADSLDGATGTLDIEAASDRIGASLLGDLIPDEPAESPEPTPAPAPSAQPVTPQPSDAAPPVQALDVPKSWKKEMHQYWGQIPHPAQQYYIDREQQMLNYVRPFQDTLKPYEHLFAQRPAHQMVGDLLKAHQMLTVGTDEQRWEHAKQLLKNLGFEGRLGQPSDPATQAPVDPVVQQLTQKLSGLEQTVLAQQQHAYNQARAEVGKQVNDFAADKAHPHFDEVADEIAIFISQGLSLQDAYDRAVWANPAVRAKEIARVQTEHEAKLKENARLQSLPKKNAARVNVRSSDTGRTPTEPLGSMDDTIKSTLKEIRARAS